MESWSALLPKSEFLFLMLSSDLDGINLLIANQAKRMILCFHLKWFFFLSQIFRLKLLLPPQSCMNLWHCPKWLYLCRSNLPLQHALKYWNPCLGAAADADGEQPLPLSPGGIAARSARVLCCSAAGFALFQGCSRYQWWFRHQTPLAMQLRGNPGLAPHLTRAKIGWVWCDLVAFQLRWRFLILLPAFHWEIALVFSLTKTMKWEKYDFFSCWLRAFLLLTQVKLRQCAVVLSPD